MTTHAFPIHLVRQIEQRWGEREPPLPPSGILRQLVEAAYVASLTPEEGRYPSFNLCCLPQGVRREESTLKIPGDWWRFVEPRRLDFREICKLAPALSPETDALWVSWTEDQALSIRGVVNLKPDWPRWLRLLGEEASGLPTGLNLRVTAPGTITAYHGDWLLGELRSGTLHSPSETGVAAVEGILPAAARGVAALSAQFGRPKPAAAWSGSDREVVFWFETLFWVLDAVQALRHGGTLLVVPDERADDLQGSIRLKYAFASLPQRLQQTFLRLVDVEHRLGQATDALLHEAQLSKRQIAALAEGKRRIRTLSQEAHKARVDHLMSTKFTGGLTAVDGAVLLTPSLRILGFGGEIRCELADCFRVLEYKHHSSTAGVHCDIEQFGMRHRSALKACGALAGAFAFVVSQDGDVALVWADGERVMIRKQFVPDVDAISVRVRLCLGDPEEDLQVIL